nr:uncharacterized protein LOC129266675 [Lytechinus pictus]
MDFKVFIFTLAVCIAVTMATFPLNDEEWNADDLFDDFEEEKRGEPPIAGPEVTFLDAVVKRAKPFLCVNPENQYCWCDYRFKDERRYSACGLRAVLGNTDDD